MSISLRKKFEGCIYGAQIGSAMGAAVEGMTYAEIEERYGFVDGFLPYEHYHNGWIREPGTTEDGIERQKLIITAILEKGDRVSSEDVRKAWLQHANPNARGMLSEPFETVLMAMANSGIPARDLGKYCDYAGLNSFARACHPIGLINAGDPYQAKEDVLEVGQLYQMANSRGLKWACVTGIAIAAAAKPNATVDSVLGEIFDLCDPDMVVQELQRHIEGSKGIDNLRDLRRYFDDVYSGKGIPYSYSFANEVVTKGVCIFSKVKGNVKDAILYGVNMGRDTDCIAAISGGISGALTGGDTIPEDWIKQLEHATQVNPYTNSKRTMLECARGLYDAYKNRLHKQAQYVETMKNI